MKTEELGKLDLLPLLMNASLKCCQTFGSDKKWGSAGIIREAKVGPLWMLYRMPKALIFVAPANFGMDVWFECRKVFSVCWQSNQIKDHEIIAFKRGPWIPALLDLSNIKVVNDGTVRDPECD